MSNNIKAILDNAITIELEKLLEKKHELDAQIDEVQKQLQCKHENVTYTGYVHTIAKCKNCKAMYMFS